MKINWIILKIHHRISRVISAYGSIESLQSLTGKIRTGLFFNLVKPKIPKLPPLILGQIGMITCFQDSLAPNLVKLLHDMGPNNGLSFASEDSPEALDINNRLVFFYR